jgi:hypothetical protein
MNADKYALIGMLKINKKFGSRGLPLSSLQLKIHLLLSFSFLSPFSVYGFVTITGISLNFRDTALPCYEARLQSDRKVQRGKEKVSPFNENRE